LSCEGEVIGYVVIGACAVALAGVVLGVLAAGGVVFGVGYGAYRFCSWTGKSIKKSLERRRLREAAKWEGERSAQVGRLRHDALSARAERSIRLDETVRLLESATLREEQGAGQPRVRVIALHRDRASPVRMIESGPSDKVRILRPGRFSILPQASIAVQSLDPVIIQRHDFHTPVRTLNDTLERLGESEAEDAEFERGLDCAVEKIRGLGRELGDLEASYQERRAAVYENIESLVAQVVGADTRIMRRHLPDEPKRVRNMLEAALDNWGEDTVVGLETATILAEEAERALLQAEARAAELEATRTRAVKARRILLRALLAALSAMGYEGTEIKFDRGVAVSIVGVGNNAGPRGTVVVTNEGRVFFDVSHGFRGDECHCFLVNLLTTAHKLDPNVHFEGVTTNCAQSTAERLKTCSPSLLTNRIREAL